MKKTYMMLAVALSVLQPVYSQQALEENKTSDNWYFGINGGVSSKITHNDNFTGSLNPSVGLRLGRYWTPVT